MLFKVLNEDGTAHHGGYGRWNLPTHNEDNTWHPGEWMPAIKGDLLPCQNGYHLAQDAQLLDWLGPAIYEAEYDGEMMHADNKIVVRRARLLRRFDNWNARTARLFAVWCARKALELVEPDQRSIDACDTAERFANGEASGDELNAAWTAARDAAWAAARDAAWAAEATAWAAEATAWAAEVTAWAAEATAWAAEATAWAAEATAWAATWTAAWDAAWAATGATTEATAWIATRNIQYVQLLAMLETVQVSTHQPLTNGG
jgi:hypothetical protein